MPRPDRSREELRHVQVVAFGKSWGLSRLLGHSDGSDVVDGLVVALKETALLLLVELELVEVKLEHFHLFGVERRVWREEVV